MDEINYRLWCHVHNVEEYENDDTYLICYECNHVYQTSDDLIAAFMPLSERYGDGAPRQPKDIHSCPLCAHDFIWHPAWDAD